MKEQDRAEKLAKAIEEMVRGGMPEGLDDEELDELLQIARIRLDAAQLAAQAGAGAQEEVLKRLLARLETLHKSSDGQPNGLPAVNDRAGNTASGDEDPEHVDVKELQEIIGMRREMAEHAVSLSESHREAVWQRVQARIQVQQSEKRGFLRWPFHRRNREAEDLSAALDQMIQGEPIWEASDSKVGELLHVARVRHAASAATSAALSDQRTRVWARIRPRIMAHLTPSRRRQVFARRTSVPWPKLAAAGAVVAVVIAALGPIPATGLAQHPVAELARFVGGHVGVTETSAPVTVPPVTEVVEPTDISLTEASRLLGAPVHKPTSVPPGYAEAAARYFPEAITADSGGVFVLAYESTSATGSTNTILVYQERSSPTSIAVEKGFAHDVTLSSGIPASYVNGSWRRTDSYITWGDDGAQTLVFESDGVRTVIHTSDNGVLITDLMAMANSMIGEATPSS